MNCFEVNSSYNWIHPHILLIIVQLSFSGWHILGSITLSKGADPIVFALYRELLSSFLMYIVVIVKNPKAKIIIHKQDVLRFIFLGICSYINVVGTVLSLEYISATRYAIFQPSIPCIATFISIVLGIEPFGYIKGLGIAIAVGGALTVEFWHSNSSTGNESNVTLGTILVIIQCTGMANLIVFQRPLLKNYDTALLTFLYYSIGTIITMITCLLWFSRFNSQSFNFSGYILPWIALVYAAIFATVLNYNIYSYVSTILSPSIITIYSTLQPFGTVILSLIILQYVMSLSEGIGGIIVIIGLLITVYGRYKESNPVITDLPYDPYIRNDASIISKYYDFNKGNVHIMSESMIYNIIPNTYESSMNTDTVSNSINLDHSKLDISYDSKIDYGEYN